MIRMFFVGLVVMVSLAACSKKAPTAVAAPAGAEGAATKKADPAAEKATASAKKQPASGKSAALQGKGKQFAVALHFDPKTPKVSQLFTVRTVVTTLDGKAVKPTDVAVDATMPAHGHGMMTKPQHAPRPSGAWLTEGMKLHMHGKWQFEIAVTAAGKTETIKLPFDQPPEAL
ncbi:MAG: FixH family protein [Myxococcales bacterium]|nr:FixH family protein [Myxococcales bacterium]